MKTIFYHGLSVTLGCALFSVAHADVSTDAASKAPKAEVHASIFAKGTSMSPFAPSVGANQKSDLEFFPRANDLRLEFVSEEKEGASSEKVGSESKEKGKDKELSKLPPHERILTKYGDPAKDAPVLAIENAPTPFKAMMESLQEGDQTLAFQYAKQYVRHLKNLQDRSTQVMSLVGFAEKREHLTEDTKGAWSKGPALEEHKLLYQKDVENALKNSSNENGIETAANLLIQKGKENLATMAPPPLPMVDLPISDRSKGFKR